MIREAKPLTLTVLLGAVYCNLALGQSTQTTLLRIDIANYVPYTYDAFDIQKFATAPVLTPLPSTGRAFQFFIFIGDIVAVNGKPAKGLWTARATTFFFEPNAVPGHSTADLTRGNVIDMYWEISQVDGTPIGECMPPHMRSCCRNSNHFRLLLLLPPGPPIFLTLKNTNTGKNE